MQCLLKIVAAGMVLAEGLSFATAADKSAPTIASAVAFSALDDEQKAAAIQSLLVDRFDRAARIALSAGEYDQQKRRYAQILSRIAKGDSLSPRGFEKLQREIAAIEQTAVDQLSLRYRVQVYSQFRTQRHEYDGRMAAWRKLMSDWQASRGKLAQGPEVIAWLETALHRMRYDQAAVLPKIPNFNRPAIRTGEQTPRIARPEVPSPRPTTPAVRPSTVVSNPPEPAPSPEAAIAGSPAEVALPATKTYVTEKPVVPDIKRPTRAVQTVREAVVAPPDVSLARENTPSEPPVKINVEELAVRIRGSNLALQDLHDRLQDSKVWTTYQLAEALDELTDLADRHGQLRLYRNLLSKDEQDRVGSLRSLDAAVALLGGKIFAARESLAEASATSPAVEKLNELSRRLAALAAKKAE